MPGGRPPLPQAISAQLKEFAKQLTRQLKENPNDADNWKKVLNERNELTNTLAACVKEVFDPLPIGQISHRKSHNQKLCFKASFFELFCFLVFAGILKFFAQLAYRIPFIMERLLSTISVESLRIRSRILPIGKYPCLESPPW